MLFYLLFLFSDPGRDKVVAPIIKYNSTKDLAQPSAILLSMDEVQGFFSRYAYQLFFFLKLHWDCLAHAHISFLTSGFLFYSVLILLIKENVYSFYFTD